MILIAAPTTLKKMSCLIGKSDWQSQSKDFKRIRIDVASKYGDKKEYCDGKKLGMEGIDTTDFKRINGWLTQQKREKIRDARD